jgi:hypothetical protein
MKTELDEDKLKPSDAEIQALIGDVSRFSFQSVRASLESRSKLFKYTWITLVVLTTLYLMGWFSGLIKPYMAASVTGLDADYQLHQIRFLLAFGMLAVGTATLNYNYYVRETFIVCAWVQIYFVVTGIARHMRTLPDESFSVLIAYTSNLAIIFILLIVLIFEETRLQKEA